MSKTDSQEGSTELSELAINNFPDPVLWISKDGEVLKFNKAFDTLADLLKLESTDLSLFDIDENLSRKEWKAIWKKLNETKFATVETELTVESEKSYFSEMIFTLAGNVSQLYIRDISEQKELESKLEEANFILEKIVQERSDGSKMTVQALQGKKEALEKLESLQRHHESILQSAGEGIYGLDCNGHTTFANTAAIEMVGWDLSELLGKYQHDIIHHTKTDGSPFDKRVCSIYSAFKDGKVQHVEDEVFWRKDGTSFPVEYISTPIWDENRKLTGAVVSFKDITRRKEAEDNLRRSNVELKSALAEVKELKVRLEQENKYLQQEIKLTHNFEEIISQSKKFKKVLGQVEQVSKTDATVLILGESGTGKELIARAVHNISKRKTRALVKVNCAALPATLIESELFGHEKGAFTGAIARKVGRFELADGGSIFLDEIGEIPIELQPKLLRVLQEGEFERLGNSNTIKVDVRVITATNVNLQEAISKGTFREDLYYRLNVFPITIPSLRERKEDIPLLTRHFLLKYNAQFGRKIDVITENTIKALSSYNWPGNIRELENVIERAVIISPENKLEIGDSIPKTISGASEKDIVTLADNERSHILKTLKNTNWRISGERGAAKILDINRTTLEARMKKLGIERP
jgi:PAS domain S-box-containing protein